MVDNIGERQIIHRPNARDAGIIHRETSPAFGGGRDYSSKPKEEAPQVNESLQKNALSPSERREESRKIGAELATIQIDSGHVDPDYLAEQIGTYKPDLRDDVLRGAVSAIVDHELPMPKQEGIEDAVGPEGINWKLEQTRRTRELATDFNQIHSFLETLIT